MTPTISLRDIVWRVAALASLPYQLRYVVNGTVDEYVRDDELVANVDALQFRIYRPENVGVLSLPQREAIGSLLTTIKAAQLGDDIVQDAGWQRVRDTAGVVVESLGIRVADLTPEYVDELGA